MPCGISVAVQPILFPQTGPIPVTTVDRVNLVLETFIDAPEGATDGEFSTDKPSIIK